jgi:hypothetical protein
MKVEAVDSFITIYHTTRRHIKDDSIILTDEHRNNGFDGC